MRIPEALMIAASGFLVVFLMLVILWLIIVLINKAVSSVEKTPDMDEDKEEVTETEAEPVVVYAGEIALFGVDEKTAACIMAIVADQTQIPLDQLIFRSIKAVK